MTKRSRKRQVRYEQSSCMWGIISILDFRHANRSSRKLLPDKRRGSRRTLDESGSTIELPVNDNDIPEGSISSKSVYDGSKTSVKALMEEEMVNEGVNSGNEDRKKYRKRSRRFSQESFDLNSNEDLAAAESFKGQDTENHDIMDEFRNRIYQSSGTNQTSKSIVVLKPISNSLNSLSESSQARPDHVEKATSSPFLAKIKRRWKNVISMGKECDGEKLENFGSKSPNPSKDRFYIEKIARPMKLDDADAIDSPNSSKRRVPNIYIEARKHLSERLSIGIEDADSSGRIRSPQTLARILSLSEFNSIVLSPKRDFQTGKLRFSGHEEENNELLSSAKVDKISSSSIADEMNSEGDSENVRTIVIIEDEFFTAGEERDHSFDRLYQNGHLEQQKETHHQEYAPLESPSSSLIIKKTEDLDRVANEAARPSPISVLEPLCMEEGDISPSRSIESVEVHIQPLQIKFDEELSKSCMDEETLAIYIKAVIQASGLNCDELYIKSQTSDQLLDPSLFDEVSFGCNHHTDEIHMLLFDCINEVLLEVCGCFLGSKKSIRPVQDMESFVSEVVKGVKHWYLTDLPRTTQTLDEIIENDMSIRGSWMDIQPHIEEIGVDLADEILDDIMEDIAATLFHG